jgi:citrate synthase
MEQMTVAQAARRLGVKPPTLYAYVSRGVLRSHRAADGRSSLFDPGDIEALARRGRPRRSSRRAALDIVIETSLTTIEREQVRYRGHESGRLARTRPFEEVAGLLWSGELVPFDAPWPEVPLSDALAMTPGGRMSDRLAWAVHAAAVTDPHRRSDDAAVVGRRMVSAMVGALPIAGDGRVPRLHLPDRAPLRSTVAGRLWVRLAPGRPPAGGMRTMNAALVLLADHELAASTLAVRVAASTRADPYAAVTAGLATISGPYHGAASRLVRRVLERAQATSSDVALAEAFERNGLYPGFGHQLYERGDPRARVLLDLLHGAWSGNRRLAQVDALIAAARRRGELPNVDLALAALGHVAGMAPDAGEAVFTIARTAGWLAHAFEEYDEPVLRFRPRAQYREP